MSSSLPPCADRCTLVADILAARAVDQGRPERAERISWGLSAEFVPPVPRATTAAASRWLTNEYTD